MIRKPLHTFAAATSLALAACAHSSPLLDGASMTNASGTTATNRQPVKEWPLRFDSHKFGVRCYDTIECSVRYARFEHGDDTPSTSSDTYGPNYLDNWSGMHGMIRNFPPPALVTWRSKDGTAHKAEIDIGELFKDELIRHDVSRDEMVELPNGEYRSEPSILLEVNDRTIHVYMRAMIFLKKQVEVAGHMRADFRDDLILVKTYTY